MASSASSLPSSSSTATAGSPSSSAAAQGPASVSVGEDLLSPGGESRRGATGPAAATPSDDMDTPERSAPEALERWVARLHAGIDRLAEAAAPRLQRLQSGMSATRGTLRRQADLVREDGEEWAESLRCTVREHPVTAVAVAAAFGMLLARLSR